MEHFNQTINVMIKINSLIDQNIKTIQIDNYIKHVKDSDELIHSIEKLFKDQIIYLKNNTENLIDKTVSNIIEICIKNCQLCFEINDIIINDLNDFNDTDNEVLDHSKNTLLDIHSKLNEFATEIINLIKLAQYAFAELNINKF